MNIRGKIILVSDHFLQKKKLQQTQFPRFTESTRRLGESATFSRQKLGLATAAIWNALRVPVKSRMSAFSMRFYTYPRSPVLNDFP